LDQWLHVRFGQIRKLRAFRDTLTITVFEGRNPIGPNHPS
jgi:hypothetical protein